MSRSPRFEAADWSLNISRYVAAQQDEEHLDLAGALEKLAELEPTRNDAEARMRAALKGWWRSPRSLEPVGASV